jgi:hypothetical protein
MKAVTHFLPANRPIPRALIAAILRDAQSGAQVQVVRARNILIGKDQSKCL